MAPTIVAHARQKRGFVRFERRDNKCALLNLKRRQTLRLCQSGQNGERWGRINRRIITMLQRQQFALTLELVRRGCCWREFAVEPQQNRLRVLWRK